MGPPFSAQFSAQYSHEKLRVAVDCLASSDAPLRDRMFSAAISALIRLHHEEPPSQDDPEAYEVWERVQKIMTALTATAAGGDEGSCRASIDAMEIQDLESLATDVVTAFALVASIRRRSSDSSRSVSVESGVGLYQRYR